MEAAAGLDFFSEPDDAFSELVDAAEPLLWPFEELLEEDPESLLDELRESVR